ncbi:MAG: OmpA family protein [Saprospiraceae bacterium]|nr:OmpA family protein [Saprospiraceae bacterium]
MRTLVLLVLFSILLEPAIAQKGNAPSLEAVQLLLDKAASFGDEAQALYQPDSAYHYALEAQRLFRKLSKRDQKRLEKANITSTHFSKLKRQFTEQAYLLASSKGTSIAIDDFLVKYPRIKHKLSQTAQQARNEFFFEEQRDAGNYEVLLKFLEDNRSTLAENSPHLVPKLEEAVVRSFVKKYPDPSMRGLFSLMNRYPRLTPFMDASLARLVDRSPFLYLFEDQLRSIDNSMIPLTVQALYPYYAAYGTTNAFERFYSHFPDMIDSVNYRDDYALARNYPTFAGEGRKTLEAYLTEAGPSRRTLQALQILHQESIIGRQWSKVASELRQVKAKLAQPDQALDELIEIIKAPEENLVPASFGDIINTESAEYSPVVSADGKQLFFCRLSDEVENIYYAEKQGGNWSAPAPIKRFNSYKNEAPLGVSADGSQLILFINGVVMVSDKTPKGWSEPTAFFSARQKSVWQGGTSISADNKVVIFAARRPDRVGLTEENNTDLYIAYRLNNGQWSRPQNLGPAINTPWEDRSPYLHPDMRTLYFSSNGHPGLGGLDVFKSTRIGDNWTEWSKPVNLGKEVNTTGNDWGYKVSTDGKEAYFAKQVSEKREEIYSILLPEKARPQQVATLSGKLLSLTGEPLPLNIMVEDMETGEPAGEIKPDPNTGEFFITLPLGKLYSYRVQQDGYYPISNNIDLRKAEAELNQLEEIRVPLLTEMLENDLAIPLKNLFFETAKYDIKQTSFKELERLAKFIQEQDVIVEISGHTDNVGAATYNKGLSKNRAEATKQYFVKSGVGAARIKALGYGMDRPVASNDTEEGRAQNRRVEIRFRLPDSND